MAARFPAGWTSQDEEDYQIALGESGGRIGSRASIMRSRKIQATQESDETRLRNALAEIATDILSGGGRWISDTQWVHKSIRESGGRTPVSIGFQPDPTREGSWRASTPTYFRGQTIRGKGTTPQAALANHAELLRGAIGLAPAAPAAAPIPEPKYHGRFQVHRHALGQTVQGTLGRGGIEYEVLDGVDSASGRPSPVVFVSRNEQEAIDEARRLNAGGAPRAAATPGIAGKTTYWKGDLAVYTGKTEPLHGGLFYEIELLEGPLKGERKVTQNGPEHTAAPARALYVQRQGSTERTPVGTIEEARDRWEIYRARSGGGVSEIGNGVYVVDGDGQPVARITYNGSIYLPGDKYFDDTPSFDDRVTRPLAPEPVPTPLPASLPPAPGEARCSVCGKTGPKHKLAKHEAGCKSGKCPHGEAQGSLFGPPSAAEKEMAKRIRAARSGSCARCRKHGRTTPAVPGTLCASCVKATER